MLSFDTNILFYAYNELSPFHAAARDWLQTTILQEEVLLSEFVLTEFYGLLRNPKTTPNRLSAIEAVAIINEHRSYAHWRLVGFTANSRVLQDKLWSLATADNFPYRRIYDARLALTLQHNGVTRFATVNEKDFAGLGFAKVWNPLEPAV